MQLGAFMKLDGFGMWNACNSHTKFSILPIRFYSWMDQPFSQSPKTKMVWGEKSNVHCYTFCLFNLDMQAIITWGHQTFSQCAEKIYLQSSIGCSDIPFSLQSTLQKVMDHLTVSSFAIVETVKFAIHTSDTPNVCGACCCYLRQNGQKTYLITPERVCSPEQTTFQQ